MTPPPDQKPIPADSASERRNINCRVSVEAYGTWREFCEHFGVSLTALLEAIAFECRELLEHKELEPTEAAIVEQARQIDAQRRARSPRRKRS